MIKDKGMTLEEVARTSRVTKQHISKIITGEIRNPGIRTLGKLINAIGCNFLDLFREEVMSDKLQGDVPENHPIEG